LLIAIDIPCIQMDRGDLQKAIMDAVRTAEIRAVADVIRSGSRPCLGQSIDYLIDTPPGIPKKRMRPYRLEVEQWHLDAAEHLLRAR
jgi:hypothetical protein